MTIGADIAARTSGSSTAATDFGSRARSRWSSTTTERVLIARPADALAGPIVLADDRLVAARDGGDDELAGRLVERHEDERVGGDDLDAPVATSSSIVVGSMLELRSVAKP